jgi:hypothetical protein
MADILRIPLGGMCNSNADIAAHLREMAQWIEDDEDEFRNVFMVIERRDGTLTRRTCGQPCDLARTMGILSIAAARAALGQEE